MKVIGVDGCTCGWLAISLINSEKWESRIFPYIRKLLENSKNAQIILIYILFGLNDNNEFIQLSDTLVDSDGLHSLFAPYFKDDYIYCLDVFEIQTTNHPISIWRIVADNKIRNRNIILASTLSSLFFLLDVSRY